MPRSLSKYYVQTLKPTGEVTSNEFSSLRKAKMFARKAMNLWDKPGRHWPYVRIYIDDSDYAYDPEYKPDMIMYMELDDSEASRKKGPPYKWINYAGILDHIDDL